MPSTTSSSVSSDFASSTVMTPSLPTFFIASARKRPISASPLAEMVPTWAISSFEVTFLEFFCRSATTAATARSTPRLRSIGFMPAATPFAPSLTIAWANTVAVVVPSPAWSDVFDATSRTIWAPMFSNLSSSSISLATVTPSLVIRGAPHDLSRTTLRPFGPRVTRTAFARMSMPRSSLSRASTENLTSLADMDASPTCPVGGNPSAQRHLDEAGSVPAALSLHLVVAIGARGIPFLTLPTREQHNAVRNKGEDQPERHDRARPVTIALVKAEQLDEHQDHFVADTTIIKVRSVSEATDRTA